MSENVIEILIYGAVILFSAIGALNKARRQKQQHAGAPLFDEKSPWSTDDEADEVVSHVPKSLVQLRNDSDSTRERGGPAVGDAPVSQILTSNPSSKLSSGKGEGASDIAIMSMIAGEGGRSTRGTQGRVGRSNTPRESCVVAAEDVARSFDCEEDKTHIVDFDLRNAVIYTEILKPKFDSY